ncbi:MAG: flagellar basal body P-ring protein FlgI [Candidatus Magnetomorum sp.]|nr:flagellar basal body P-ring protein FlgI [Candidatus Magnetomorum sp.]
MKNRPIHISFYCLLAFVFCVSSASAIRLKDMSSFKGVRNNQLMGYGLIVGLNGTGDKAGTDFTVQSLVNMLERMGVHVDKANVNMKNVAAVMVTSNIPPFAKIGQKVDITISSLGDAQSLQGGTLLLTPLRGVDRKVYALAQGPLSVGGYTAGGAAGGGATKNHPTVARISRGASIEREIPITLQGREFLTLMLNNPDFTTAIRVRNSINEKFGQILASTSDSGTVQIQVPHNFRNNIVQMIAAIENLQVVPDTVAKVIVNEKTGTVVIGENVRISTVAVAHGNLSIQIKENINVSQPSPFAPAAPAGVGTTQAPMSGGPIMAPGGQTVVSPNSDVYAAEEDNKLLLVPSGSTIGELVRALNAIGVTPRDLMTILMSIKAAGALQAEIEIL